MYIVINDAEALALIFLLSTMAPRIFSFYAIMVLHSTYKFGYAISLTVAVHVDIEDNLRKKQVMN
jgi:hypothetical protein